MKKIIALASIFNRKEMTLQALESLYTQKLPGDYSLKIILIDDKSTDGSAEAVMDRFPETMILNGNGNMYWAGAMRYAWDTCIKEKEFDLLLVFNDDIILKEDALKIMIQSSEWINLHYGSEFALSGCFCDPFTRKPTYGGFNRNSFWHPLRFRNVIPDGRIQEVVTVNMNFTIISRPALIKTDFLRKGFIHNKADLDFGLNLSHSGGKNFISPEFVGFCSINSDIGTSREQGIPVLLRWKRLLGPKEESPFPRFVFFRKHGGFLWPVLWLFPYGKMILISIRQLLKINLFSGRP